MSRRSEATPDLPSFAPAARGVSRARDAAERHSRRVRRLRIWLPVIGGLVALGVVGWTFFSSMTVRLGLNNVLFTKDGVTMVDPHISGRSQGRSYEMTAQKGLQAFDDPKKVRFEKVSGRIEMQDRKWAKVEAATGIFDGTKQTLQLDGGIDVVTSDGYHITTQSSDLDLDKGTMVTKTPVRIVTSDGTIDAGSARVEDHGRHMVFSDRVFVTLQPKQRTVAPEPNPQGAAPKTTEGN
jgi:lipopolysaccharide export system protein LptC